VAALTIRFDLRVPDFASTTHAAQYAACLEMCQWAEQHGFGAVSIPEHHGLDDGYLPAPLTLAGVILGRTSQIMVTVAASILVLHDPVRIAEQVAVLDNAAPGRLVLIVGLGYRDEEFAMAGIPIQQRGRLLDEYLDVLVRAWTGEPFTWRGRTIRVTPRPATRPHPMMMVGGSGAAAAKRAARFRAPLLAMADDPQLADVYTEACQEEGFAEGFAIIPTSIGMVHVSDDPERDWARIGPHAVFDASTYHAWARPDQRSALDVSGTTVDAVRASGVYRIVTPDECVALADELGPMGTMLFHPLMGGMPPEIGWEGLELFASKVAPRLA
jgi:alkanesulfonate monooxygenase SsuD/methylene tetrahydromethanopterin reductase-like flavin-dependent oxidoreductase (luciferase family)